MAARLGKFSFLVKKKKNVKCGQSMDWLTIFLFGFFWAASNICLTVLIRSDLKVWFLARAALCGMRFRVFGRNSSFLTHTRNMHVWFIGDFWVVCTCERECLFSSQFNPKSAGIGSSAPSTPNEDQRYRIRRQSYWAVFCDTNVTKSMACTVHKDFMFVFIFEPGTKYFQCISRGRKMKSKPNLD